MQRSWRIVAEVALTDAACQLRVIKQALQVGCGVGNTALPLAATNASATIHSCDYSATAVRILQQAAGFHPERMTAFVADITKDSLVQHVPAESVDAVTCVFALSANALPGVKQARHSQLHPSLKSHPPPCPGCAPAAMCVCASCTRQAAEASRARAMLQAVQHFKEVLRPRTGTVLVRDYAAGDLAEQRLAATSRRKRLDDHFYVRGDGTRCLFFTEVRVQSLLTTCAAAA